MGFDHRQGIRASERGDDDDNKGRMREAVGRLRQGDTISIHGQFPAVEVLRDEDRAAPIGSSTS